MKRLLFPLALALVVSGCNYFGAWDSSPEDLVWVQTVYAGGEQCSADNNFEPPDTKAVLQSAGIAVYDTFVEHQAVCAACGCPAYAATHYAQIERDDVERAKRLGFEIGDDPPR